MSHKAIPRLTVPKQAIPIAIARGDGIGPEIMDATLHILNAAGVSLELHEVQIGEKVYLEGEPAGIRPETWDILRNTKAFLKAPITTPQGGGYKSLNVTVRTTLGLYANIRPCVSYFPFVRTKHPKMDVVIVRENEEDLYTGIEYPVTDEVVLAYKILSRAGCERILHCAFAYAKAMKRRKVTCFTKDNILKITDGLFHRLFTEIGELYPDLEKEHWIVDIGAAKLADTPEIFDVIVLPNLYGDILSDVAAQIAGSVGMAGSANLGEKSAMFEAIHGSAPRQAGKNTANPSGLLLASVMMLVYLGLGDEAARIHNAWLRTLEEGVHTYDIHGEKTTGAPVGTAQFAEAVAKRLGKNPEILPAVSYPVHSRFSLPIIEHAEKRREGKLIGVDLFVDADVHPLELAKKIQSFLPGLWKLEKIGNRGVTVWPMTHPETFFVNSWQCRIVPKVDRAVEQKEVSQLFSLFVEKKLKITHLQNLFSGI